MSDGFGIPSLNFSDPHYYNGFPQRRKIRQKVVCYGILTILQRKTAVAISEIFSSDNFVNKVWLCCLCISYVFFKVMFNFP